MNVFGTTTAMSLMGSIATSTSGYLVTFSPIFEAMGGLVLAMALIAFLISMFGGKHVDIDDATMDI